MGMSSLLFLRAQDIPSMLEDPIMADRLDLLILEHMNPHPDGTLKGCQDSLRITKGRFPTPTWTGWHSPIVHNDHTMLFTLGPEGQPRLFTGMENGNTLAQTTVAVQTLAHHNIAVKTPGGRKPLATTAKKGTTPKPDDIRNGILVLEIVHDNFSRHGDDDERQAFWTFVLLTLKDVVQKSAWTAQHRPDRLGNLKLLETFTFLRQRGLILVDLVPARTQAVLSMGRHCGLRLLCPDSEIFSLHFPNTNGQKRTLDALRDNLVWTGLNVACPDTGKMTQGHWPKRKHRTPDTVQTLKAALSV